MAEAIISDFYVYEGVVDGVRRYIGKGSRRRKESHLRMVRKIVKVRAAGKKIKASYFYNKLTKAFLSGADISFNILVGGLTEEKALELEIEMIASERGQLWNVAPGGDGFSSKQFQDERFKSRLIELIIAGWDDIAKKDEARIRGELRFSDPDFCARHSAAVSADSKKRWADPKGRENMLANRPDQTNPEHRKKMSTALKAARARQSAEQRRIQSLNTWITRRLKYGSRGSQDTGHATQWITRRAKYGPSGHATDKAE